MAVASIKVENFEDKFRVANAVNSILKQEYKDSSFNRFFGNSIISKKTKDVHVNGDAGKPMFFHISLMRET